MYKRSAIIGAFLGLIVMVFVFSGSKDTSHTEQLLADVIGIYENQCDLIPKDPETGKSMMYCCLDEIVQFINEGETNELEDFLMALHRTSTLSDIRAEAFFNNPYSSSIHRKNNADSPCGKPVECDSCMRVYSTVKPTYFAYLEDAPRRPSVRPTAGEEEEEDGRPSAPSKAVCGDGQQEGPEECDAGEFNSDELPDACRTNCMLAHCGDGVRDIDEECDEGIYNSSTTPNVCRQTCRNPFCGDGVNDSGEYCDDGNNEDGDGCSAKCVTEYEPGAEPTRPLEPVKACGDGIRDPQEECDDGNTISGDGCSSSCILERKPIDLPAPSGCGNGIIEGNEQCDNGEQNSNELPDHCRENCILPYCGDGTKDRNEWCDDGNMIEIDGCSSFCVATDMVYFPAAPLISEPSAWPERIPVETGPAAIVLMAAGAAAGFGWMRRRRSRRH